VDNYRHLMEAKMNDLVASKTLLTLLHRFYLFSDGFFVVVSLEANDSSKNIFIRHKLIGKRDSDENGERKEIDEKSLFNSFRVNISEFSIIN
jgi:hypothetical protein